MNRFDFDEQMIGAGQPSADDLKSLADEGVKTVIDLRPAGEAGHPDDEADTVQGLGMRYHTLPIAGPGDLTRDNAKQFGELLASAEKPVVIHCGSSNRVGALVALKANMVDGLSPADALALGQRAGLTGLAARVEEVLTS